MASPVPNPVRSEAGRGEASASGPALVLSESVGQVAETSADESPLISSATRLPALDGLRGIAIFLGLVFHLLERLPNSAGPFHYLMAPGRLGWSGVDLFFQDS